MKPAVTLPDAERAVIDLLVAAGHSGVSAEFPATTLAGSVTAVQVEQESGNVADYPVLERVQLRVVAYAAPDKRTAVKALAARLLADLYSFPGDVSIAGIAPLGGRSAVTTDPDTRNEMCWVLVRVNLKASLAS